MSTDAPDTSIPDNRCQGCGSHVTARYRRVRGLDDKVYACPNCPDDGKHDERDIAGLRLGGGEP